MECTPVVKKSKETWTPYIRVIVFEPRTPSPDVTIMYGSLTSINDYSPEDSMVFTISQIDIETDNISSVSDSTSTVARGNFILSTVNLVPYGSISGFIIRPGTLYHPLIIDFFFMVNKNGSQVFTLPSESTPPTFSYTFPPGFYFGSQNYINFGAGNFYRQNSVLPFPSATYQLQNPIQVKTGDSYTTLIRITYNGPSNDLTSNSLISFFGFALSYGLNLN